jgi:hypothetical protein
MDRNDRRTAVIERLERDLRHEERVLAALEQEIRAERQALENVESDIVDLRDVLEAPLIAPRVRRPSEYTPRPIEVLTFAIVVVVLAAGVILASVLVKEPAPTGRLSSQPITDTRWTARNAFATGMAGSVDLGTRAPDTRWTGKWAFASQLAR